MAPLESPLVKRPQGVFVDAPFRAAMYKRASRYNARIGMDIQVSKWGNSLAMRIPSEIARQLGVTDGDILDAKITVDGGLSLRAAAWNRAAFAAELKEARAAMPLGSSVIEELRRGARY